MKKLELHWQILISIILSIIVGILLPQSVEYISWLGTLFLNSLKMVIVPLVFSSIVVGVSNIGSAKDFGRLGAKTMVYYMVTSLIAILTGLLFVNLIQPGNGIDLGLLQSIEGFEQAQSTFGSTILNIIPTNIFQAFTEARMLSIIFFAMIFGYFITKLKVEQNTTINNFFNGIFEIMMNITMLVIKFAPIGIFGIVTKVVAEQSLNGNLWNVITSLSLYMLTVVISLFFHAFFTLPLILKLIGKVSPKAHYKALSTPLLTAFSTASSNATLPLTMEAIEYKVGISKKITSFVIPLGATINMDGTALYELVAAMFIAQAYGVEVSFSNQFLMVFAALLSSIGAAGIPMAGLVMMSMVLSVIGLPLEGIGLILAVDRILDMLRTTVNVYSDTVCASIVAKSEGEHLKV
jgi:Na+/H+-dicarboxylate symporter